MRKFFWLIIFVLLAFLLALWSPWNHWNFNISQLFGVTPPDQVGGLLVSTLAGEVEIYLDGSDQSAGSATVDNSPFSIPGIRPGDHQVKIIRKTEIAGAYWEFNKLIHFIPGVDVIIAFELGPTAEFSEGHVIYASPRVDSIPGASLNVTTSVEGVDITIDGTSVGQSPLKEYKLSVSDQHKILLQKEGYEAQEFLLLPDKQEDRDKLKGFNLNVDATLFLQPLLVNDK